MMKYHLDEDMSMSGIWLTNYLRKKGEWKYDPYYDGDFSSDESDSPTPPTPPPPKSPPKAPKKKKKVRRRRRKKTTN